MSRSKVFTPYLATFVRIVVLGADRWMGSEKEDAYVAHEIVTRKSLIEGLFKFAGFGEQTTQILFLRLGLDMCNLGIMTRKQVAQHLSMSVTDVTRRERAALHVIFQRCGWNIKTHHWMRR